MAREQRAHAREGYWKNASDRHGQPLLDAHGKRVQKWVRPATVRASQLPLPALRLGCAAPARRDLASW